MLTSQTRYALLRDRLGLIPGLLGRVEKNDLAAAASVQAVLRHLRELLPVLQLDSETARKLGVRLRRIARRLGEVCELGAQLELMDEVSESNQLTRSAATRVANDIRRRPGRPGADTDSQKAAAEVRRTLRKLNALLADLQRAGDRTATLRGIRWAVRARLARRAATLKRALDAAGSLYLPGRLREVRKAARKLYLTADLVVDVAASSGALDLSPLEHAQTALDSVRYTERLIDRSRCLQGALAPPDLKAWQDLDALVVALENRCRRLHARYVRERSDLLALCDRFGARASVPDASKRKVS